ncbi:MAG: hypothetical protein JWM19_330 [Actinomycetia bacterium]|nr:hypothetical protein [Actinomycetes bacterium]
MSQLSVTGGSPTRQCAIFTAPTTYLSAQTSTWPGAEADYPTAVPWPSWTTFSACAVLQTAGRRDAAWKTLEHTERLGIDVDHHVHVAKPVAAARPIRKDYEYETFRENLGVA